jgi:hypothetical protein
MAIRGIPKNIPPPDEKLIRAVIGKGGGVKETEDKTVTVQLRLKQSLIRRIDNERGDRIVPPSRHAWLLEAIKVHLGDE